MPSVIPTVSTMFQFRFVLLCVVALSGHMVLVQGQECPNSYSLELSFDVKLDGLWYLAEYADVGEKFNNSTCGLYNTEDYCTCIILLYTKTSSIRVVDFDEYGYNSKKQDFETLNYKERLIGFSNLDFFSKLDDDQKFTMNVLVLNKTFAVITKCNDKGFQKLYILTREKNASEKELKQAKDELEEGYDGPEPKWKNAYPSKCPEEEEEEAEEEAKEHEEEVEKEREEEGGEEGGEGEEKTYT